jgi:hypothetical protein
MQRIQETPDRLGRRQRRAGRVEPAQIHIQLPIRVPVPHPLREMHRQRRLTHTGGTPQRGKRHRGGLVAGGDRDPVQLREFFGPTGETVHVQG